MPGAVKARYKYIKKIPNYYGKGKHKYIYAQSKRSIERKRRSAVTARSYVKAFKNLIWPEMTKEEQKYFKEYAMATGKMAPLWPSVMERAFRLADVPFTVAGAGIAGKGVGTLVRLAGKKVARQAMKKALTQALKKAARKGIKAKAKAVGRGVGKALEAEYGVSTAKEALRNVRRKGR